MIASMTEGEFLRLSKRFRHKKGAELLRSHHECAHPRYLTLYRRIENWLQLPFLQEEDFQKFSDRYHFHLTQAGISWKEHNLLTPTFRRSDHPSLVPYLPLAIYLDNLRSAFNVGSILRTTEAFRLGKVCFAKDTPFIDNLKVQKTSMETFDKVPCDRNVKLSDLPPPLIALETDLSAPSVFDFRFPKSFTLMLGNEEYGLSEEALSLKSEIVRIPLYGFKNSLNVASAFAIAAGVISHQLRTT
ncbi:MAG: TrmH family RNA methyltransferase [Rhabdochlamydiaceae bacterium]|jgi:tRNA G18 (ribose-2'-O)-methylase SpoU